MDVKKKKGFKSRFLSSDLTFGKVIGFYYHLMFFVSTLDR